LQNHTVEVLCDKVEDGGLEQTRPVVEMDRRRRFEAERILCRVQVEIFREHRDILAMESLAREKRA
jgi:hypothetical protein